MYKITSDYNPSEADNQILSNALMAFNEKVFGEQVKPISIFLKDDTNSIRGGIVAYLQSDSIHVDVMWVDESIRRQGYGDKLLKLDPLVFYIDKSITQHLCTLMKQ